MLARECLAALCFLLMGAAGCAPLDSAFVQPLAPRPMSPQAVALDVISVWLPPGDDAVAEDVWREIDEQRLSPEERRALQEVGFRVGLIAGTMPSRLERLLDITSVPDDPTLPQTIATEEHGITQVRHLQLRLGSEHHGTILASGVHDELPLLSARHGVSGHELGGRTYHQAQGQFRVTAGMADDGRVNLEVVPELEHGVVKMGFAFSDGVVRPEPGRPRIVFDELRFAMALSPGQMLVIGPQSGRLGGLGQAFLIKDQSGRRQQKLLLVRLAQTQYDALFHEALDAQVPRILPHNSGGPPAEMPGSDAGFVEIPSAEVLDEAPLIPTDDAADVTTTASHPSDIEP